MKALALAMFLAVGCAALESTEPKSVKVIHPGSALVIPPQACRYSIEGYDDDGNGTIDRVVLRMDMECKRRLEKSTTEGEEKS